MSNWTLFSNHGHVLFCLSRNPQARLRDVAADVGITERAVQKIVRDLQDVDMISVTKNGRRNSYRIHHSASLRHDIEAGCTLKDLLKTVNRSATAAQPSKQNHGSGKTAAARPSKPAQVPPEPGSTSPTPAKPVKQQKAKPTSGNNAEDKNDKDSIQEKVERQQGTLF